MKMKNFMKSLLCLFCVLTLVLSDVIGDDDVPKAFLVREYRSAETSDFTEETSESTDSSDSSVTPLSTDDTNNIQRNNSVSKNITISWDEVEQNFNKVLTEDEVAEKWQKMEQKLKSGVRAVLRMIFPKIVAMSADAKVSGNCSAGILKWIVSLRHLKSWAIKMLDATGKPPSGIFEGVVTMFGNYDECTKVRVYDDDDTEIDDEGNEQTKEFFRGQYCIVELKPWLPKKPHFYGMNSKIKSLLRDSDDTIYGDFADLALFFHFIKFRLDLCVPSTCTKEDMQKVAQSMAQSVELRARILRCEIASDQSAELSSYQTVSILIFSVLTIVILISTVATFLKAILSPPNYKQQSSIFKSLSLINSWKSLVTIPQYKPDSKPVPIYGIRAFITIWIVLVHTAMIVNFQFFREMQTIKTIALKWPIQLLTNSSLQFDSLILLSSFSLAYYNYGKSSKQVLEYVIKKYLRLTPLIFIVSGILVLFPFFISNGPVTSDFVTKQVNACQENGLWNIIYIQNFFTPYNICLPHTWIFCVELQLSVFFIPFIMLLNKYDYKITAKFIISVIFTVIIGFLINAFVVYNYKLPPTWLWTLPDPEQRDEYFYIHLYKPWTHLSVFAIGVIAGAMCKNKKTKLVGPYGQSVTYYTGWSASFVVMIALIYGCHDWVEGNLPDPLVSAIFDASHRLLWALANCWILFTIASKIDGNKQTFIAEFLSQSFFVFIGKLSLLAYLIHPLVQLILLSTQQQHLFSNTLLMGYIIIGNIIITYTLSFVLSLTVEIPICCSLFRARIIDYETTNIEITSDKSMENTIGHNNQLTLSIVEPNRGTELSNTNGIRL